MEDADSDSGIDSDGSRHHAGRDELHGLRTNAVGPDGEKNRVGGKWSSFPPTDMPSASHQNTVKHSTQILPLLSEENKFFLPLLLDKLRCMNTNSPLE